MVKSVVIDKSSFKISNLKVLDLPEQDKLSPKEVRIKNKFAGLNIVDIDAAQGAHPMLNKEGVIGFEAVGEIIECGKSVKRFKEGDYVACATSPKGGALAESMVVEEKHLLALPQAIPHKTVAASVFKGMVAHYLVTRAYIVQKQLPILIHDIASAQAQYLSRWARSYGAIVLGTIADKSAMEAAEAAGCQACFSYKDPEWSAKLLKSTENYGVACIYDSIGVDVFEQSMNALSKIGIMMMYGASSGIVENIPIKLVKEKSLFLSAPSLFDYKNELNELVISAAQLFHAIEVGILEPKIANEISIDETPKALAAMKAKDPQGSVIVCF